MQKNPTQNVNDEQSEKKDKLKTVLRIIGDVLLGILLVFAAFVLIVTITAKKDKDGTSNVFGYKLYFVKSESMEKCEYVDVSEFKIKSIPTKSCVFVSVVPDDDAELKEWYKTIKVGDVLTFRYSETGNPADVKTITHRVCEIEAKGDGFLIHLRGDNRNSLDGVLEQIIDTTDDRGVTYNYIIGRVTGQSYLLGLMVYAFRQPVGIIFLIIVPCLIIIAFQVMRIVKVVNEDKKEKSEENEQKQKNEIEELKRQIEMLKQNSATDGGTSDGNPPETSANPDTNE